MTLRARLILMAAVALVAVAALAIAMEYANRQSSEAMRQIHEESVIPLQRLFEIDDKMKEVRFRIAGVMVDQLPAPGSRNHLNEVRGQIPKLWDDYLRATPVANKGAEELEATEKISKGIAGLTALFDDLDRAYQSIDPPKNLTPILEDDWPMVHVSVIKPMADLLPLRVQEVELRAEQNHALERKLRALNMVASLSGAAILIALAVLTIRAIGRAVADMQRTLARVAQGDLTVAANARGRDELAAMGRALNETLARLRETLTVVSAGSTQVVEASAQVKRSAADNHTRAESQAEEVMKMSAAMEELTVSVTEISAGSEKVSQAAGRAQAAAENGGAAMRQSRDATERAKEDSGRASAAVTELSDSVQKISTIAGTIREIADQTNLLALNAAIEAARAGEAGRGFAVVADEVRKLAERTGSSTSEIAGIVRAVESKAATAVTAMAEVDSDVERDAENIGNLEAVFAEILDAATEVASLADEIAHSTREQKLVAEQTASGMETISQAVEQTSASLGLMASAAEQSAGTAEELKRAVAKFRVA